METAVVNKRRGRKPGQTGHGVKDAEVEALVLPALAENGGWVPAKELYASSGQQCSLPTFIQSLRRIGDAGKLIYRRGACRLPVKHDVAPPWTPEEAKAWKEFTYGLVSRWDSIVSEKATWREFSVSLTMWPQYPFGTVTLAVSGKDKKCAVWLRFSCCPLMLGDDKRSRIARVTSWLEDAGDELDLATLSAIAFLPPKYNDDGTLVIEYL